MEHLSRRNPPASPLAIERPAWPSARPGEEPSVSFPRKRESRKMKAPIPWVPACAGTNLDSCFRRNDTSYSFNRLKCYRKISIFWAGQMRREAWEHESVR